MDDRRLFLQQLTLGGLALTAAPSTLSAAESFVRQAANAAPLDVNQADPYDYTWTNKLTGKHKAVYDSPDISGGLAVYRAGIVAAQYQQAFKVPASAISNVIVLRHDGIQLAMKPEYWEKYNVGARKKVLHPWTEQPYSKNPALMRESDGIPAMVAEHSLDKQLAKGVIVLACALAFAEIVGTIAATDKVSEAAANTKARSLMFPGILMQPSGVFATTLAQEKGCVYVRAS